MEARLRLCFAEPDVEEALLWLRDPELALHQLELPACFDCERCPLVARCGFVGAAHVTGAVKARHEARPVGCDDLAHTFNGLPLD